MFKGIFYAVRVAVLPIGAYLLSNGVKFLSDTDTNVGWYAAIALFLVGLAALCTYGYYLIRSFSRDFDAHQDRQDAELKAFISNISEDTSKEQI